MNVVSLRLFFPSNVPLRYLLALIMTLAISACGGGGGSGADPGSGPGGGGADSWSAQLGAAGAQTNLMDIAIDSLDGVYAVGFTNGDMDGQTRTGLIDMYITRYDSLGAKQFTRMLGAMWGATRKTAHAHAVATDSNNNAYVVGYTSGSFDGNNWFGIWSMFLVKFDSDGNKIFSKTFGASAITYPTDITIDESDNIYVAGYETGSFGGAPIGNRDLFLAKFDTGGNLGFVKKLGVSSKIVYPQSIASDTSGNVYVSGYTSANLNGETLNGNADIFVVKFDAAGNVLFTRLSGDSGTTLLTAYITVDASSNSYITGYTSKSIDGVTPTGLLDTYMVMYDSVGTKVFTKMYGVAGTYVQGMAVTADSVGNVYITGSTNTGLDGNLLAGATDSFLLKYDSSGVNDYAKQIGASGGNASGRAIAIDSGDNIFIAGNTNRGLDGNSLIGTQDFFISKYDSSGNLK